jgi:hypothetical protein
MLARIEVDPQVVSNWIRTKTAEFSAAEQGESLAEAIARDLLDNSTVQARSRNMP